MPIYEKTLEMLIAEFGEVTSERDPTSFAGYALEHDIVDGVYRSITISQHQKITDAITEHLPHLVSGIAKPSEKVLSGTALEKAIDGLEEKPSTGVQPRLDKDGKATQSISGSLKYVEKGTLPIISIYQHKLACKQRDPVDTGAVTVSYPAADRARTLVLDVCVGPSVLRGCPP